MKKLTAEEFAKLSKEEKDKKYKELADGEMSRYRLLYDIPVPIPVGDDLVFEMTDEKRKKARERLNKFIEKDQILMKEYDKKNKL